jgi:hypothetical protein
MPKRTIVLVHGAWADGSSWSTVASELQGQDFTVFAPPNLLRPRHPSPGRGQISVLRLWFAGCPAGPAVGEEFDDAGAEAHIKLVWLT